MIKYNLGAHTDTLPQYHLDEVKPWREKSNSNFDKHIQDKQ